MVDEAADMLPEPVREYYEGKLSALEMQGALYEISNCAQLASLAMNEDGRVVSSGKLMAVQMVIERVAGIAHALAGGSTVSMLSLDDLTGKGGQS